MGSGLYRRYQYSGKIEDLENSIDNTRKAIEVALDKDLERSQWLSDLSTWLRFLSERKEDLEALGEAHMRVEQAVSITPAGHPMLSIRLSNRAATPWGCINLPLMLTI